MPQSPPKSESAPATKAQQQRQRRLAEALRANLRKRKDQARQRSADGEMAGKSSKKPSTEGGQ